MSEIPFFAFRYPDAQTARLVWRVAEEGFIAGSRVAIWRVLDTTQTPATARCLIIVGLTADAVARARRWPVWGLYGDREEYVPEYDLLSYLRISYLGMALGMEH